MELKTFGGMGVRVSEIGMGTYYDPGWMLWASLGWRRGSARRVEALREGLAGGINLIDTAEIYNSEGLVAEAIKGYGRQDLFIATKVSPTHLGYDSVLKALQRSLNRLRTPYVDLYQVHFPRPGMSMKDTMRAMEDLLDQGKIRAIGVSNFSLDRMVEANAALRKARLASTQMEYSLSHRSVEEDILPYCAKENIAVLAYRPLGHGKLATEQAKLRKFCEKYSKTPAQVALRWLASQPGVFPIPRASNPLHVKDDLGASGWQMEEADLRELGELFPA
jgi:diketogulonate reductase-like aldo/keto reductase